MAAPHRRLIPPLALLLLAPTLWAEPPARTDAQGDPLPAGALARLGTIRFRDGNYINGVALAPDGKTVAVSGNQGIRLLDVATGKEARALKITGFANFAFVAFAPDGKLFAAADFSGRIQFWNPATGEATGQVAPPAVAPGVVRPAGPFTFSGDGKYVAVGSENNFGRDAKNHATVYEVATGKQASQVEVLHNANVRAFLSPDGKVLATSGQYLSRVPNEPREKAAGNRSPGVEAQLPG